jgi:XTP/dITP diphosphohydrolase
MNTNQLVFASANPNKVKEVESKLGGAFPLLGLLDIGCHDELPETTGTIPGNAQQKASYVFNTYNVNCFADDTGLEIDALHGEPGVNSADYALANRNAEANMLLVLKKMQGIEQRTARFRTSICLFWNGEKHLFEGVVEGQILLAPAGSGGFGYDPIFQPLGFDRTFAQMDMSEKNAISHRAKAIAQLRDFILNRS